MGKSVETESKLVAAQGWGAEWGNKEVIAKGHSVSIHGDKNILKIYCGGGCPHV